MLSFYSPSFWQWLDVFLCMCGNVSFGGGFVEQCGPTNGIFQSDIFCSCSIMCPVLVCSWIVFVCVEYNLLFFPKVKCQILFMLCLSLIAGTCVCVLVQVQNKKFCTFFCCFVLFVDFKFTCWCFLFVLFYSMLFSGFCCVFVGTSNDDNHTSLNVTGTDEKNNKNRPFGLCWFPFLLPFLRRLGTGFLFSLYYLRYDFYC